MAPLLGEKARVAKPRAVVTKVLRKSAQVARDCTAHMSVKFQNYKSEEDELIDLHKQIDRLMVTAEVKIWMDNRTLFEEYGLPFRGGR
ncbi:hypothetical protein LTR95_018797, partial [Oleoguttula sp. CCFEE 5521]